MGEAPSVVHGSGTAEFKSAKIAIDKDLGHILGAGPLDTGLVYSVHYSDINGLSRLENNILAHEISEYIGNPMPRSYVTTLTCSSQEKPTLTYQSIHDPQQ